MNRTTHSIVRLLLSFALFPLFAAQSMAVQIEHGTLTVPTGGTRTLSTATSPGITFSGGINFGDYPMIVDPQGTNDEGVMVASIVENGPDGRYPSVSVFPGGSPEINWVAVHYPSTNASGSANEWNSNVAFAFFSDEDFDWAIAGTGTVNSEVITATNLRSSSGITFGTNFFDNANGTYTLDLTPTDANKSSQNGILLTNGSKNEGNFALAKAESNGSFTIFGHDNGANNTTYERDAIRCVYIPTNHGRSDIAAMGRIDGSGNPIVADNGTFTVTKSASTGIWFLSIPGHTPDSGTLILTPEGGEVNNVDNLWSYEWDAANQRWEIHSRDINSAGGNPAPTSFQNMPTEAAFSFVFVVNARVIHVDSNASSGGDGISWGTAFDNLQDALDNARNGDEIWIADGIYRPTQLTDLGDARTATFTLKNGVKIYGGFDGTETLRSERDPATNASILSGDLSQNDGANFTNNTDNAYKVLTAGNGITAATVLDGLTITAGNADLLALPYYLGGGLHCSDGASPSIAECRFEANRAYIGGAVAFRNGSTAVITDSVFENNHAIESGGAVYSFTITTATTPEFNDCTFLNNNAETDGGAVMDETGSSPTYTGCLFQGNTADRGGAVQSANTATSTFLNCSFLGNSAGSGGAIRSSAATLFLTNCILQGNFADTAFGGAGLYAIDSSATLTNCTLQGNHSTITGGGIISDDSTLNLYNSIIWNNAVIGNTTAPDASIFNLSSVINYSHSLVQNLNLLSIGTNNLDGTDLANDPQFIAPIDPLTAPQSSGGNLRLGALTPVVEAGDNNLIPAGVTQDLAGNARIAPFGNVDLGAYEGAFLTPPVLDDLTIDMFSGSAYSFTAWAPDNSEYNSGSGLLFQITLLSTTGDLGFDTLPGVNPDGSLNFTPTLGTGGTATFELSLSDPGGFYLDSAPTNFTIASDLTKLNIQPSLPLRAYIRVNGRFPSGLHTGQDLGEVKFFASDNISADYLPADGRLLQTNEYDALFALLGSTYGGNGVTTFAIPDLRGRVPIGAGSGPGLSNYAIGDTGGTSALTLNTANLPVHTHTTIAGSTDPAGAGSAYSNRQPYIALQPFIVTNGSFPPIDEIRTGNESEPYMAEIIWFAGTYHPEGWTLANGQTLQINSNVSLFALLRDSYGGDAQVTFKLPDLRGRAVVGVGNGTGLTLRALADAFGTESETMTISTMAAHSHLLPAGGETGVTGNGQAQNNMMPSLSMRYIACSETGEVRIVATYNEVLQPNADGQNGRPDLHGRVTVGENDQLPYTMATGIETSPLDLLELPFHAHTGPAYLDWINQFYPGESDPNIVGLSAQPTSNLQNGIIYLFDGDPTSYDSTVLPEFSRDASKVTYVFRLSSAAASLAPYVEYTDTLTAIDWNQATDGVDGVVIASEADGFETGVDRVTVTIPHGGADQFFARLRFDTPE